MRAEPGRVQIGLIDRSRIGPSVIPLRFLMLVAEKVDGPTAVHSHGSNRRMCRSRLSPSRPSFGTERPRHRLTRNEWSTQSTRAAPDSRADTDEAASNV